ncbi:hypothetical protein K5549_021594, partial [Capra hircus]
VALLIEATLPSTGSGLTLWLLESGCRGELLGAHGALVFLVGVGLVDVGEQRVLVDKDLGAVDALQVGLLGELGVAGEHVLLQLLGLAEGVLAVVAHCRHKHTPSWRRVAQTGGPAAPGSHNCQSQDLKRQQGLLEGLPGPLRAGSEPAPRPHPHPGARPSP